MALLFAATVALITLLGTDAAPSARLVRSTSGPNGSVQGNRYVVEDPRTSFQAGVDHKVVVFFEWDARPGRHRCEASWRDPSGKVVLVSPSENETRASRFGVFWTLELPDTPALGLWAVEVAVDGSPGGTHTFQVSAAAPDASGTRRSLLPPRDVYARVLAATVAVEALGAQGGRLGFGSGFYLDDQHVVTAFQVLEGASGLRVVLPSGRQLDAGDIVAMNRRQDWAVLRTAPSGVTPLTLAPSKALAVGDRATFLDASEDGGRTLQDVAVVGRRDVPGAGARLNLSSGASPLAIGSPLLNDFGEVVGVMGGTLYPGAGVPSAAVRVASVVSARSAMAIPADMLPDLAALKPETFRVGDLLARGVVAAPVTRGRSVLFGSLGHGDITARRGLSAESEFSRRDGVVTVQATWDTAQKQEGEATFRVFDVDNRLVGSSQPAKVKARAGEIAVSSWKAPLADLPPGVYRIDLLFGDGVAWRSFFTVTD